MEQCQTEDKRHQSQECRQGECNHQSHLGFPSTKAVSDWWSQRCHADALIQALNAYSSHAHAFQPFLLMLYLMF